LVRGTAGVSQTEENASRPQRLEGLEVECVKISLRGYLMNQGAKMERKEVKCTEKLGSTASQVKERR
jgi:hypothetical protein